MKAIFAPLSLLLSTGWSWSAIAINGVSDETVYTNRVTFEVEHDPSFDNQVLIDGEGASTGTAITVEEIGFHELVVTHFAPGTSEIVETETVHFIVRNSERGNSENGLPSWTPRPNVPASNAEINEGRFQLIVPESFPSGRPIPVAARLLDENDKALRVVADARINEETIRLFRGVGGRFLPPVSSDESHLVTISAASRSDQALVEVRSLPTTVSPATINTNTNWNEPGIVRVNEDLTIAEGATLTIGPGVLVEIGNGVDLHIEGSLQINGEKNRPVVMTAVPGSTWGGCFVDGEVNARFLFVTEGGEDDDWFSGSGYSSHRDEQATFLFDTDSNGSFEDCFWLENPGQPLHSRNATLILTRCLVQKSPTTGQFNGGSVVLRDCHLVEFPVDSAEFTDDDNDAIYFTAGDHELHGSVIGWAKDDGVDAGSGSSGTVLVEGCWFESCFHEAMAWSGGGREITVRKTVALNSGQGIECGWSSGSNSPIVRVTDSITTANSVGLRFGDNYDWNYEGFLEVSNSMSLYNDRDVWGFDWDSWTYRTDAMDVSGNWLTQVIPEHPDNRIWDGSDLVLIKTLEPTTVVVGAGFSSREMQRPMSRYGEEIGFGFSSFGAIPPGLGFSISSKVAGRPEETSVYGGLRASPGQTIAGYSPNFRPSGGAVEYIRFTLHDDPSGQITTPRHLIYLDTPGVDNVEVAIPLGSEWAYLDNGTDPGAGWIEGDFDDSSWQRGRAELGYGDGDEATEIDDSRANYPTYYFRHHFEPEQILAGTEATLRLRRDDGAIVYLNGIEIMRSNMNDGTVSHSDFARGVVDEEDAYVSMAVDASLLIEGDDNVLAVEIHQANATSSDTSFDLELSLERPLEPKLFLTRVGESESLMFWNGGNQLEESTDLVTWTPVAGATSPMTIKHTEIDSHRFYRLRRLP